jgi:dihydroorotate dehydrogenase electron transfer subunit
MYEFPVSLPTSLPAPLNNDDGTRTAIIAAPARLLNESALLPVHLPGGLATTGVNGRYFLARCGIQDETTRWLDWQIYLRRPLFGMRKLMGHDPATDAGDRWVFHIPVNKDPGFRWLLQQPVGQTLNLLGPFGQGFTLQPQNRNLLLLADATRVPLLFALSEAMLDRGGRVTLLVRGNGEEISILTPLLPLPIEVRQATSATQWEEQIAELTPWADQIALALPKAQLPVVAGIVRRRRFRVEPGFAQALIEADLVCGVGACLACVVPVRDGGYTRACVHGPVMDLMTISL